MCLLFYLKISGKGIILAFASGSFGLFSITCFLCALIMVTGLTDCFGRLMFLADKVMKIINPDDNFVRVHDYHLMISPIFLQK